MQKIAIENFLAVQKAELNVDEVLLLIGEQASGKSTVAKLIYFFKSLRADFFQFVSTLTKNSNGRHISAPDLEHQFKEEIERTFLRYFGAPGQRTGLLTYSYSQSKSIEVALAPNQPPRVTFSDEFVQGLFTTLPDLIRLWQERQTQLQERRPPLARLPIPEIRALTDSAFEETRSLLFIPAYRGVAVMFPNQFKLSFFGDLSADIRVRELQGNAAFIDAYLMQQFLVEAEAMRDAFVHPFADFVTDPDVKKKRNPEHQQILKLALSRVTQILKGEYRYENDSERLYFANEEFVELANASSGQQDAIRMIQDIFLTLLYQQSVSRIIEEPEAHLYPMAQKHLVELFALLVNYTDSQVILTTHSPYVLSVFNILLYATRVAEFSPSARDEIAVAIPEAYWLNPDRFHAYALQDGFCKSIINHETGLIDQNFLDEISEELGDEFNILYSLHAESMRA